VQVGKRSSRPRTERAVSGRCKEPDSAKGEERELTKKNWQKDSRPCSHYKRGQSRSSPSSGVRSSKRREKLRRGGGGEGKVRGMVSKRERTTTSIYGSIKIFIGGRVHALSGVPQERGKVGGKDEGKREERSATGRQRVGGKKKDGGIDSRGRRKKHILRLSLSMYKKRGGRALAEGRHQAGKKRPSQQSSLEHNAYSKTGGLHEHGRGWEEKPVPSSLVSEKKKECL